MNFSHFKVLVALAGSLLLAASAFAQTGGLGREVGAKQRLADGEEYLISTQELFGIGADLFNAVWTVEEGGGRPLTNGVGGELADPSNPLVFPRNFNRVSAPDANSCAGCHNQPVSGGAGDIVANVFVLGQRFDFAGFDGEDPLPLGTSFDENGNPVNLGNIANSRLTTGMFGAGYLEMLARQMTADLQAIRDSILPGGSAPLMSKGVSFGTLARTIDGSWDVSAVEGLSAPSTVTTGLGDPPNLVIRPFHQASAVVSLRQFTNNAFNHHHGIQTTERFGLGADPDGDGYIDEMSRAEVTATSIYQAALPVPGRVIPRVPHIEDAVLLGEQAFAQIGCTSCHIEELPLDNWGWFFTEPNPYNPAGNLQPGEAPDLTINLNSRFLPGPRLNEDRRTRTTYVPAYTDMKLHDITSGPDDPNREALNMHFPGGSDEFLAGNSRFLTKRLWGAANTPPYFHHGKYTTLRQAILAHAGEAEDSRLAFEALSEQEKNGVIEFLKTLQVLPEGTRSLVIDEKGRPRNWPPN